MQKFIIPTAITTLAGIGMDLMANMLQPFWPTAPHWVFAFLFYSGATLTVVPISIWIVWVGFKLLRGKKSNGSHLNTQVPMQLGNQIPIPNRALIYGNVFINNGAAIRTSNPETLDMQRNQFIGNNVGIQTTANESNKEKDGK